MSTADGKFDRLLALQQARQAGCRVAQVTRSAGAAGGAIAVRRMRTLAARAATAVARRVTGPAPAP